MIDAIAAAHRSASAAASPSAFAERASFAPAPAALQGLVARSAAHVRERLLAEHGALRGALAARGVGARSGAEVVGAVPCALDGGGAEGAALEEVLGAMGAEGLKASVRALRSVQVALVEDIAAMRRALAEAGWRAENAEAGCGDA